EGLVELFDRFFFCRSFHSKLFPFGGLRLKAGTTGLYPSPSPEPDPKIGFKIPVPRHAGRDDIQ
ncbi:hypothetical protein, partial [Nitrobacter sp. 62-13]|uniref:hypothetical protein n=1 Tax=Nitrobacter sp. 62-13 TaxID=1895797 RepID=UPI0025CF072F